MHALMGMLMLTATLPPNPKREAPPPGIEERAAAVGAQAPQFTLPVPSGGRWTLRAPTVIVFYRGHW